MRQLLQIVGKNDVKLGRELCEIGAVIMSNWGQE